MKRKYHYFLILFGSMFLNPLLFGQTVNSGLLYVAPDTEFSSVADFQNQETGKLFNDGVFTFYSNFLNDGSFDYLEEGEVKFTGSNSQILTGQGETYFWNLVFDNESSEIPFSLYSDLLVEGNVIFKNGIIDIDSFGGSLTFGEQADHSGASAKSFVDGAVTKTGISDFEFPIGDKGHHRVAAISDGIPSGSYSAKYYFENPDAFYPLQSRAGIITRINDAEYWEIMPTDEADSELVVTLSWDEATTPSSLLKTPQELHIARWDEAQQLWVDEGGLVDETNRGISAVVSDFGIFTLASVETGAVLPCQLAVYNAITPNNDGKNDHFIIDQLNNGGCADRISVIIFNRWNKKVFETNDYGKAGKVFDGYSQASSTIGREQLPTGTYFYILEFEYSDAEGITQKYNQQGYLYLNGN